MYTSDYFLWKKIELFCQIKTCGFNYVIFTKQIFNICIFYIGLLFFWHISHLISCLKTKLPNFYKVVTIISDFQDNYWYIYFLPNPKEIGFLSLLKINILSSTLIARNASLQHSARLGVKFKRFSSKIYDLLI